MTAVMKHQKVDRGSLITVMIYHLPLPRRHCRHSRPHCCRTVMEQDTMVRVLLNHRTFRMTDRSSQTRVMMYRRRHYWEQDVMSVVLL